MGNIRLYGSTSGYTELAPPAVAPDGVVVLPSGTGTLALETGAWTAYTPVISGSTWSVGNGSIEGYYAQVGKLVFFNAVFTLGSTSGKGSASPQISFPIAAKAGNEGTFNLSFLRSGVAWYMGFPLRELSNTVSLYVIGSSGVYAQVTSTAPFTWTTGDKMVLSGMYEAA